MKGKKIEALGVLAALLFTFSLCLLLCRMDNKYTSPGPQPISGILYLTQEDVQQSSPHYLIRDWVFYPNVLISPEERAAYSGYRRYVDIGGEAVGHGIGTYALTLMLPTEPAVYGLELPEVFSSCALFINGEPVLTLGDPSGDDGAEAIGSRAVSFHAAGETELLVQFSDFSGIYSGMTYAPAFGTADAVMSARESRLLVHGAAVMLSLLGVLLSLSFGFRADRLLGSMTALLCLCLAVSTGYPLLHGLWITPFQPWYTLEAVCYYALVFLAVVLQTRGLASHRRIRLILPCALGVLCALVRFGGAAFFPTPTAWFSWLSLGIKFYAAGCLLWLSASKLQKQMPHAVLPLCGSVSLSVCLICDRLFPLYEPIIGGWFAELGGVLLVCFLGADLWLDSLSACRFRLTYQENYRQMVQRLNMQKTHYAQLTDQIHHARESAHDLRHHMRTIRTLAEQGNTKEILAYLNDYEPHAALGEVEVWCENPAVDAVLGYYAAEAKKIGAQYDVHMVLPSQIDFPEDLLCILLSNILENAVEAMACQREGSKKLYLRGTGFNDQLRLAADNTFSGEIRMREGLFLSTKHEGLGLGISSVRSIVSQYGGLSDFEAAGGFFHVSLLIPLEKKEQ